MIEKLLKELRSNSNSTKDLGKIVGVTNSKITRMRKKESFSYITLIQFFKKARRKKDRLVLSFHYLFTNQSRLIKRLKKEGHDEDLIRALEMDMEISGMFREMITNNYDIEKAERIKKIIDCIFKNY